MKKRSAIGIALGLCASISLFSCASKQPPQNEQNSCTYGVGYALVHGGEAVARATVLCQGDETVVAWDEACLPCFVQAGEDVDGADKVCYAEAGEQRCCYRRIAFGGKVWEFDAALADYRADGQALASYLENEQGAKAYLDAVFASELEVVLSSGSDTTRLDAQSLFKAHNGYWSGEQYALGYLGNYQKTIEYFQDHGLEDAESLERDGTWRDRNGVDTGATWVGLNSDSHSYVQLVKLAAEHGTEAKIGQAYGLTHGGDSVARATLVTSLDGNVLDVRWEEACLPQTVSPTEDVSAADTATVGSDGAERCYAVLAFADRTWTYQTDREDYSSEGQVLRDYLATDAGAQAYFEALDSAALQVKRGEAFQAGAITKRELFKLFNGYWSGEQYALGYPGNYGKVVTYVRRHGTDALDSLERDGTWRDANGVDTGATLLDLNAEADGYLNYVQLIQKAKTNLTGDAARR